MNTPQPRTRIRQALIGKTRDEAGAPATRARQNIGVGGFIIAAAILFFILGEILIGTIALIVGVLIVGFASIVQALDNRVGGQDEGGRQ